MKVLIVEDDPMVRNINAGFLKKISFIHEVFEVSNVSSAKEVIKNQQIDLILLDVYLGESSGPDLLKWVRDESVDADVVLITADNSAQTVEKAFRLGAIDYLIKPFNFKRFQEALEKVLLKRKKLKKGSLLSQDSLDEWLKKESPQEIKREKGINQATYETVKGVLLEGNESMTAGEIGEKSNLARVTVRRYLEHMVKDGIVVECYHYGKIGRPQKTYQWVDERKSYEK